MARLLFAAAAIAVIVALAASKIDGKQMRFADDTAHKQCVAAGYIAGTPLYLQCRGRVVQGGAAEYQEAIVRQSLQSTTKPRISEERVMLPQRQERIEEFERMEQVSPPMRELIM